MPTNFILNGHTFAKRADCFCKSIYNIFRYQNISKEDELSSKQLVKPHDI